MTQIVIYTHLVIAKKRFDSTCNIYAKNCGQTYSIFLHSLMNVLEKTLWKRKEAVI